MEVQDILNLQDSLIKDPSLQPSGDTTYCNFAVQKFLTKIGYLKLNGMMADEMYDYMDFKFMEWQKLQNGDHAKERADLGDIVVAAHKYTGHGHVALVRPGCPLAFSGHWRDENGNALGCPTLSNIGKKNGIVTANFVFPVNDSPPNYYRLLI